MNSKLQSVKQRYGIIGQSPQLNRSLETSLRVANTDLTVLITGESGVGKEVFSRIIHENSARKHSKFIAINCGAIPEGTINSELFGHEKGAFTGATADRKGYFETVDGGVMFLDEIGEMPLDTQAYLLRILENGEFIRVGSNVVRKTDIRIVAATNVNLLEKIKEGKFREDLYYRLNTVPIYLPPLRERGSDVYMLFRKFSIDVAEKYKMTPIQLTESARMVLEKYSWPGNIRQLKNFAEQLAVLSPERTLDAEGLLEQLPDLRTRNLPVSIDGRKKEEESFQEREILYKFLFEMKSDLNDLKSLVFELIENNNLSVSDATNQRNIKNFIPPAFNDPKPSPSANFYASNEYELEDEYVPQPILLNEEEKEHYQTMEVLEESLSLEEHTKRLIQKALKKHNGRRKDAAKELGISERTLYRKISDFNLD